MNSFVRKASLLITLILFSVSPAYSCSCGEFTQRYKFRTADIVFLGKVIESREIAPRGDVPFLYSVTFEVEKQWKGAKKSKVTLLADWFSPGWCGGTALNPGSSYLIYAVRDPKEGLVTYTKCSALVGAVDSEEVTREIKNLNSFWFRLRTRLWPFWRKDAEI